MASFFVLFAVYFVVLVLRTVFCVVLLKFRAKNCSPQTHCAPNLHCPPEQVARGRKMYPPNQIFACWYDAADAEEDAEDEDDAEDDAEDEEEDDSENEEEDKDDDNVDAGPQSRGVMVERTK